MKCLYCHEIIDPSGKFCPKCGLPLNEDVTVPSVSLPSGPAQPGWSVGVKPLAALIAASMLGAFIGVSVGWLGGRNRGGEGDTQAASPAQAAPVQVSQPLVPPTTRTVAPSASPASRTPAPGPAAAPGPALADASVVADAPDLTGALTDDTAPIEPAGAPAPDEPRVLSDAEFEAMYADVWAGISPRKRYVPSPVAVARIPDPIPPSHRLATSPFRRQLPAFITAYWLPTTIQGVSGSDGPGPAESASHYEQH